MDGVLSANCIISMPRYTTPFLVHVCCNVFLCAGVRSLLELFGHPENSDHMCSALDICIDPQHRYHVDSTAKCPTVIGNCEHERQLPQSFLFSKFEVPGETNEQSTCKVILVDAVAELIKED